MSHSRAAFLLLALGIPPDALALPCVTALPVVGELSSGFGMRNGRGHPGVDLRAPVGTPVRAAAPGIVTFAGTYYDYGLMVEVEHADGSRARYAHLAWFASGLAASRGVVAGQEIGAVGRTGRTTGANLHVELRRAGRPVDPWPWLTGTGCLPTTEVAEARR